MALKGTVVAAKDLVGGNVIAIPRAEIIDTSRSKDGTVVFVHLTNGGVGQYRADAPVRIEESQ